MRRSHPNLNHPQLYKLGEAPPKCYSLITSTTFFGFSPRTLLSASPRKEHFLSLILIVYSLSRLRSIGSLFGTSVLNIGAVCADRLQNRVKRRKLNLRAEDGGRSTQQRGC
ncbi:hypothetical protein PIB30_062722 [Stylosanthes scabra]|uniref:Uncharacterized protein n=1 Tax=Stylosanthes scabra TaxID=79078 RepID=A0ABU6VKH3_9FABA|nr:hypothetical protein [Stylosanthes scabra]